MPWRGRIRKWPPRFRTKRVRFRNKRSSWRLRISCKEKRWTRLVRWPKKILNWTHNWQNLNRTIKFCRSTCYKNRISSSSTNKTRILMQHRRSSRSWLRDNPNSSNWSLMARSKMADWLRIPSKPFKSTIVAPGNYPKIIDNQNPYLLWLINRTLERKMRAS